MTLNPDQVQHFRNHGWLAVPEFFSARETAAIRAEVERLKREGFPRNVATDGDGKTTSQTLQNLQLCPRYHYPHASSSRPSTTLANAASRQA